jgi:hypothetical protein
VVLAVWGDVVSRPASFDIAPVLVVGCIVTALVVLAFIARVRFDGLSDRSAFAAWLVYQPLVRRPTPRWKRRFVGLDLVTLAVATVLVFAAAGALRSLPPGYDTWGHLAKIRLMEADWPRVNWNPHWYGGVPYFQGSYPPGYHATVLGVARLGVGVGTAMTVVNLFGLVVIVTSCYLAAYWTMSSRVSGWISAGFFASSGLLWFHLLGAAIQPRTFGLAGFCLAVAGACGVVNRGEHLHTAITALGIAWAIFSHLMVGAIGGVLTAILLIVGQTRVHPAVRALVAARPLVLGGALSAFVLLPLPFFVPRASQAGVDDLPAPWRSLVGGKVLRVGNGGDQLPIGLPSGLLAGVVVMGVPIAAMAVVRRRRRQQARQDVLRELASRPVRVRSLPSSLRFGLGGGAVAGLPVLPGRMPPPLQHRRPRWHAPVWSLVAALPPCLIYAFAGHFMETKFVVNGLIPIDILVYPTVLLSVLAGALTMGLATDSGVGPRGRIAVPSLGVAMVVLSWLVLGPAIDGYAVDNASEVQTSLLLAPDELAQGDLNRRIAADDDTVSRPISAFTVTPQLRGYQANAILDPDWQFAAEFSVTGDVSEERRAAVGRWWGFTNRYVPSDSASASTLAKEPNRYQLETEVASGYAVYRQRDVAGVVSAESAPVILFVGDDQGYRTWFSMLLDQGVGPERAILTKGPRRLSDLRGSELEHVDSVIVDGVDVRPTDDVRVLDSWVRRGGSLFIESANSEADAAEALPSPFPVTAFETKVVGGAWNFLIPGDDVVEPWTKRTLDRFGPAQWNGTFAWEIKQATELQPWARAAASTGESMAIVVGELEQGTVTWSGMNLAFHASLQDDPTEIRLLAEVIGVADAEDVAEADTFDGEVLSDRITAVNPDDSAGLLVRQNKNGNWRATVDGQPTPILEAGPGFMFVPTDQAGVTIKLWYSTSLVEQVGWWTTLLAVALLLTILLHPAVHWAWCRVMARRRALAEIGTTTS